MKRVLITGASGFIGRHCLDALIARGYEVHAAGRSRVACSPDVIWHESDLLTSGSAVELVRGLGASHLLHFAWYTKHGLYWAAPENGDWLSSSIELFDAFVDGGGQRVVCAGTCAEYAWNNSNCDERRTPLVPDTLYGRAKVELHRRLEVMARKRHISLGWGRIFFPYGPYESAARLVPSVIDSLLRCEPMKCTQGNQRFDYMYVGEVADAFAAFLDSDVTGAVNVASGIAVRVRDVVMTVARHLGGVELIKFGALPARDKDPKLLVAEVERLRTEVGWLPTLSLDEGLTRTIEWRRHTAAA